MNTTEKLARLHNRATAYEVVATRGTESILIGYTSRHSRGGLLGMCRKNGQAVINALGLIDTDMLIPAKKAADGFTLGSWSVRFTGRTQRDAISNGELPFVVTLAEQKAKAA